MNEFDIYTGQNYLDEGQKGMVKRLREIEKTEHKRLPV